MRSTTQIILTLLLCFIACGAPTRTAAQGLVENEFNWIKQPNLLDSRDDTYVREQAVYRIPFSLTESEKFLATATLGAVIFAFATEKEMVDFVQKNDGSVADRVARFAEPFGGRQAGIALLAGGAYGVIARDGEATKFFSLALKSAVITKALNDGIKKTFRRALPNETSDPFQRSEKSSVAAYGMPSGHASTAFSLATIVAETYGGQNSYIPVLAYGTATLTSWSRVYDNQHWVSDVLVGALLGHVVAKNVMRADQTQSGFEVTPYFGRKSVGLQLTYEKRFHPGIHRSCQSAEGRPRSIEKCLAASLHRRR